MRGSQQTARLIAVAVVVLGALGLVALAARSDRTPTLTPIPASSAVAVPVTGGTGTLGPDSATASPDEATGRTAPEWLLWSMAVLLISPILLGLVFVPAMIYAPAHGLPWFRRRQPADALPPEVDDEVEATQLSAAVEEGLRELDQGGAGDGVVASWVLLEQAAADAGTHRSAPNTPSELVGRLIDRHPVSSTPLLRLAELYREARFSRHQLPESARTEARAALEQLRAELEASPVGRR